MDVYLDHAATTPLRPEVREAMAPYWSERFGNPSSRHRRGQAAAVALEQARETLARALGARPREVRFVRGGTESDNLAVAGRAAAVASEGRRPLLACSAVEHRAVLEAVEAAGRRGAETIRIPVGPDARPDPDALEEMLARSPDLVSMIWVNNETGTVLPVAEVARRCRAAGVPFHTDAVQAVGKIEVDLEVVPVALLSLTGHKLGGPKGTGALVVREGVALEPLLHGGGQEGGLRPGTEDVAGAVGLAEAVRLAVRELEEVALRMERLRDRLETRLRDAIPGLRIHGAAGARAPHVLSVGVPGVDGEALLSALDLEGVAASGGSACASGGTRRSHVLAHLHGEEDGRAPLRFSLGRETTELEVERAAEATRVVFERIRAFESSGRSGAEASRATEKGGPSGRRREPRRRRSGQ